MDCELTEPQLQLERPDAGDPHPARAVRSAAVLAAAAAAHVPAYRELLDKEGAQDGAGGRDTLGAVPFVTKVGPSMAPPGARAVKLVPACGWLGSCSLSDGRPPHLATQSSG
jgi:hypothetical protein